MAYNFQYQAKTQPVLLIIAAVSTWFMPLSEPVRDQPYEVVSDVSTFPVPIAATSDVSVASWYQPLGEPVKDQPFKVVSNDRTFGVPSPSATITPIDWAQELYQPRLESFEVVSRTSVFPVPFYPFPDKWFTPLSEPVRQKPGLGTPYQQAAWLVKAAPFPETVTEDRWHQPWSTPTLRKPSTVQQTLAYVSVPIETITEDKWHQPWSIPTLRKPSTYQQTLAYGPVPIVAEDKWHQPWSIPTVRKSNAVYQQSFASGLGEITSIEAKWHQPWSELLRRKPSVTYQQPFAYVAAPTTFSEVKWYQPWSEPARRKASTYQQTIAYVRAPETITEDKWHQPWSEPTRRKSSTTQQDLAYGYLVPSAPVTVTPIDWAQELYQPRPESFEVVTDTAVFVVPVTIPTDIKWFEPWSEPSKPKRSVSTASQQFLAWGVTTPAAAALAPIGWLQELSQPKPEGFEVVSRTSVYVVPRITSLLPFGVVAQSPVFTQVTLYQSVAFPVPIVAPPPPVVPIDWAQSIYQPQPQGFDVVSDSAVFIVPITPEVVTQDKWYQPWSVPTRRKPPTTQQDLAYLRIAITPEVITEDKWHQPWSIPTRRKPSTTQQTLAWGNTTPSAPVVTPMAWASELSQPRMESFEVVSRTSVFVVPRTITLIPFSVTASGPVFTQITPYQSVAFPVPIVAPPPPITEDEWHQPWSQPVRLKPGLRTGDQQLLAYGYFLPPISIGWLPPLSTPPKAKAGLKTAAQQFLAAVPFIEDNKIYAKWGFAWSEPVRDLAYEVSSSICVFPFEFVPAQVTVTLSATETNGDIFEAAIVLYTPATRCLVSIKEIRIPSQSLSSIEEPEM